MESLVGTNDLGTFYHGKKIFVTGHTGFKGAWLITWLSQLGSIVKGYALPPESDKGIYSVIQPHIKHTSVYADIRDKKKLTEELLDFQPDIIFHLAAQPLVRKSYELPAETFETNVTGTANLLEALTLLDKACTCIVITTDKVYDNHESGQHFKETDRLGGYDPYSASKAATEIVVASFRSSFFNPNDFNRHQKVLSTVRAGNVIGGGDWSQYRIIPDIIKSLESNQQIPVRNPNSVRPWQHVLEPLSGYMELAAKATMEPHDYLNAVNFGPEYDDHLPVKELVELAIEHWGSGSWADYSAVDAPHEAGILKLDISLAKQELGWMPKLDSTNAIAWTLDWYRQPAKLKFDATIRQIKTFESL